MLRRKSWSPLTAFWMWTSKSLLLVGGMMAGTNKTNNRVDNYSQSNLRQITDEVNLDDQLILLITSKKDNQYTTTNLKNSILTQDLNLEPLACCSSGFSFEICYNDQTFNIQ